jgi:hypothetical protein
MRNLVTPGARKIVIILGIAILMTLPVAAQANRWNVDSEHSTASIFLGSKSDLQNTGIVRVEGDAAYDSADPAESALAISTELPGGALMTFKSKRGELQADGTLRVVGEMTLSQTERDANYNPGEDYYGPIYGKASVRKVTREVAFVLPPMNNPGHEMEVTAEAKLGIENFPELFAALRQAAWQPVVQDKTCDVRQAGEDYRGAECSGSLIAPAYRATVLNLGEDYRGDESPVPSGNLLKIVLRLQLKAA